MNVCSRMVSAVLSAFLIFGSISACAPESGAAAGGTPAYTADIAQNTASASAGPQPSSEPGDAWFAGDWAGVYTSDFDPLARPLTDFGTAFPFDGYGGRICLVRISRAENGYKAELGSSRWALTEYDATGFSMRCAASGGVQWDEYRFSAGDVLRFTYTENLPSSLDGARVPTREILRGATRGDAGRGGTGLLLARLPPAEERSEKSGLYPHWYGGYENSPGPLKGLFCLGADEWGNAYFGAYVHHYPTEQNDLIPLKSTLAGIQESTRVVLPCENGFDGLIQGQRLRDAPSLFWPSFYAFCERNHSYGFYEDVTREHRDYFSSAYPAMLEQAEARLLTGPQDVWTERKLLAIKGLKRYAALAANGALASELLPHVPKLVSLESGYLPAVSLAGLKPGDTLADAQRLCALAEISDQDAYALGFGWSDGSGGGRNYTDGKGLIIGVLEDGRIDTVYLYASGYQTPDGRQVGDSNSPETDFLYGRDARIAFLSSGSAATGGRPIESVSMRCVLDRVWSETEADIDGDGEKERLTLSGRSSGDFPECGAVLHDSSGLAHPDDFGTKTTLKVYKDGILTEETTLPLSLVVLPCFFREEAPPGRVRIWCDSGGNSDEQPAYLVEKTEDGWHTTFLGHLSH